ncbi:protein of unknown function [Methylorubrum extorquens]|uniref:Uncharacterized protein n=1 Tax=Methylorubrum extorquens TaxID=408 RepID=A0A2N9ATD4_METEX|nr:protein of unknown function [Methylorubrum extorquens]
MRDGLPVDAHGVRADVKRGRHAPLGLVAAGRADPGRGRRGPIEEAHLAHGGVPEFAYRQMFVLDPWQRNGYRHGKMTHPLCRVGTKVRSGSPPTADDDLHHDFNNSLW